MSFLDTVKKWFSSEVAEARNLGQDITEGLDRGLTQKEANLRATPEEKIELLQNEIAASDESLNAIRDKVEGQQAHAAAVEEIADSSETNPVDET